MKERLAGDGAALPAARCPVCDYAMDAATAPMDRTARPSPGDLSCCMKCGELLIFGDGMDLRIPLLSELVGMPASVTAQLSKIQRLIRRERVLG